MPHEVEFIKKEETSKSHDEDKDMDIRETKVLRQLMVRIGTKK